jgi:hypothetical protein
VIAWQAYNIRPGSGIVANNIIITSKDRFGNAVFMNGGLSDIRQTFANNLYYAPSGAFNIRSWSTNNANYTSYASWQAVTGETGGLVTNPLLSGTAGSVDTCGGGSLACPKQYTLQAGSPAIGAGSNLPSVYGIAVGARDFFGAMVPRSSGSGHNIGATGVAQTYPFIDLSAATLRSDATQGVSIGTLSVFNGNGPYTFTVTNSAMSRVEVSGSVLQAGSVSSMNSEMPLLLISIQATNGTDTLSRYFVVMVAP